MRGRRPTRQLPRALAPGRRGSVRIVGGRWRGRRLSVPAGAALRPTPDRVRETLFNWLAPHIEGARCLDLFAGSGALGFEAASRGAAEVILVERAPALARSLREQARTLAAEGVQVVAGDALGWLARGPPALFPAPLDPAPFDPTPLDPGPFDPGPFDIVFLDPPFAGGLLEPACAVLESAGWLAPGGLIYVEQALAEPEPRLPDAWVGAREGRAGRVRFRLLRRQAVPRS